MTAEAGEAGAWAVTSAAALQVACKGDMALLSAEIAGMSHKMDQKASQASLDDLGRTVKIDLESIRNKLDIIIAKTGNQVRGPAKGA